MTLDPLSNLVFSALSLLQGAFWFSIPVFIAAWIGVSLQSRIMQRFHFSWVFSAFLSLYGVVFTVALLLYYFPFLSLIGAAPLGDIPAEFQDSAVEVAIQILFNVGRLVVVSLILALVFLPIALMGSFLRNALAGRESIPPWAVLYLTTLSLCILVWAFILFLIPWAVAGVLALLFYGIPG